MKILISGSHGFIGSMLHPRLKQDGHTLLRLIRPKKIAHSDEVFWDYTDDYIDHTHLNNIDAVIHLAGENIFGRWTDAKRKAIHDSRVLATEFLCENLVTLPTKPKVLLCASAIGYYGSRGDEELDETSSPGEEFLAKVCRGWEAAAQSVSDEGIRVVNLRFGMVLGKDGGALAKMLPAFKLGTGGPLGDGTQWLSWISLEDAVGAIEFALNHESLQGPINIVAPEAIRNKDFARTLGKVLHRPEVVPVPKKMLHIMFGDFADETLLASTKLTPAKLTRAGYEFQHPTLQTALEHILAKKPTQQATLL
ncbi:MAG: TIGR01777 family oxidoreductase [Planctomycetota bacterium]|jgi:uncharacterized protein (TIGR01777 family)